MFGLYALLSVGLVMSSLTAMLVPELTTGAWVAFTSILGYLGIRFFTNDLPHTIVELKAMKTITTKQPDIVETKSFEKMVTDFENVITNINNKLFKDVEKEAQKDTDKFSQIEGLEILEQVGSQEEKKTLQ